MSEALEELGKRRAVEEAERAREVAAQDAGAKKAAASVAAKANELTAEKVRELGFDTAVEVHVPATFGAIGDRAFNGCSMAAHHHVDEGRTRRDAPLWLWHRLF